MRIRSRMYWYFVGAFVASVVALFLNALIYAARQEDIAFVIMDSIFLTMFVVEFASGASRAKKEDEGGS